MALENDPDFSGTAYVEAPAGETLTDSTVRSGTYEIVVRGGGTVILTAANTHSGGTRVEAGELVLQNTKALGAGGLQLAADAKVTLDVGYETVDVASLTLAATSRIDVQHSGFVMPLAGNSVDDVRTLVKASYTKTGSFTWNHSGPGLGSSLADSSAGFAVGYAKSLTDITVRWAALGDTNLDGAVTFADVRNIVTARRYNQGIKADNHWYLGDFDYNDQINIRDIFYLRALYNQGNYRPQTGSGSGSGNASGFSDSNKTTG